MPRCESLCRFGAVAGVGMLLVACTTTSLQSSGTTKATSYDSAFQSCRPAEPDEAVVGNWLSTRKEPGVAGEIRLQIRLHADGSMHYVEQLKRGNKPPQTLSEIGCWYKEDKALVLRTTHSNGSQVETQDPIYIQRHDIIEITKNGMALSINGKEVLMRRTSPDYRLPIL